MAIRVPLGRRDSSPEPDADGGALKQPPACLLECQPPTPERTHGPPEGALWQSCLQQKSKLQVTAGPGENQRGEADGSLQ